MLADPLWRDAALLLLSWLLGGFIGWQRELEGRAAGLRTHMLVCGGSCLISLISFGTNDPGRIAAQIVTGIGFLGAGMILRRGVSVRGLTSAASIWVVAGIGIAVGAGSLHPRFVVLSILGAALSFMTLTWVKRIEERVTHTRQDVYLYIRLPRYEGAVARLMEALTQTGSQIMSLETDSAASNNREERLLTVHIRLPSDVSREDVSSAVTAAFPGVDAEWDNA
jgi:putative Mg2+ transporter-C (MgtC) family protein